MPMYGNSMRGLGDCSFEELGMDVADLAGAGVTFVV